MTRGRGTAAGTAACACGVLAEHQWCSGNINAFQAFALGSFSADRCPFALPAHSILPISYFHT